MRRTVLAVAALALALPAATMSAPRGKLELLTWEGYAQKQWVLPFEHASNCSVTATYARSPADMPNSLRKQRGRFDLVSASGDISGSLIRERLVRPIDRSRVPAERNLFQPLRSLTAAGGAQYGIATLWGANLLLYRPDKVAGFPTWGAIYDERYRGKVTVPDNPLQIADAALHLGVLDPFRLTKAQLASAVALLKRQRLLVSSYWRYASDEVTLFDDGRAWIGPGWQWQARQLADKDVDVRTVVPREGATAWVDSWMLAAGARDERCAYAWLRWISAPAAQAALARDFGGQPANRLACRPGLCSEARFISSLKFWKTPGFGCPRCAGVEAWQRAWVDVRR